MASPVNTSVEFIMANGQLVFQDREATLRLLEHQQIADANAEKLQLHLEKIYSVETLALRLDISTRSAYELIRTGQIRYVCPGKKNYRITEKAVREYTGDLPATD